MSAQRATEWSAAPGSTETIAVGLGQLHVTRAGELVAYSLGSCVAICLYDPVLRVAGMAHVVLPSAPASDSGASPGKYADTAVPALLGALRAAGAMPLRLRCHLVGGAAVLALAGGALPDIGARNVEAVRVALERARIAIAGEATGGRQGRTVRLEAATGRVRVRAVLGPEVEL
ncbi:MAG: chemotaxis protein CheD [Chloroflexi bacterium]|nr:chemotaxis protein CheD [Chloroflexota bacterium]